MESKIENRVRKCAKDRGGMARKVKAEMYTGWPDEEVFLPSGRRYLIETKFEDKGSLSPRQRFVIGELAKLGTTVHVLTTIEAVDQFFELVDAEII